MCLKVNSIYSHGPAAAATSESDSCGPVEITLATALTSIPVSCMRTQSDHSRTRLICLCHLDEGRHSIWDAATLESLICCDSSSLATIENDFLAPHTSSPPEAS